MMMIGILGCDYSSYYYCCSLSLVRGDAAVAQRRLSFLAFGGSRAGLCLSWTVVGADADADEAKRERGNDVQQDVGLGCGVAASSLFFPAFSASVGASGILGSFLINL